MYKKIHLLSLTLLITLTACVNNSGDITPPENCISWFDGCNNCFVSEGKISGCTLKFCSPEEQQEPNCLKFKNAIDNSQGAFCGGIAAIACEKGYECKLDGEYPDAGGICIKELN